MELNMTVLLIIFGGAIVTMLPRVLPLAVLSKVDLPDWVVNWLKHIPVAIMAALLAQELLIPTEEFGYFYGNLRLLAAIPTILVAIFTRSLLGTVIVGILSMMLLRFIF
ncbi:AzlD domain-containing protein [Bacillus chungangensis]|uniref:Branched-subunit amino acid transport protein n=1 Tax=Bacillus chungangensis TaxID=587633 RepID=A0ABT9WU71_9BACI|nr:AzlD domain-containing protein [Bacillus chungangensis]MDQ0176659.1 branched-subunit amino acid transport protein [Bacillus chungangensis]